MLDIKFIRENPELVAEKAKQKGYDVDVKNLLVLDKEAKEILAELQPLREKRNRLAERSKGSKPNDKEIIEGKELRKKIVNLEFALGEIVKKINTLEREIPNIFPDDTPLGGEEASREERKWGEAKAKDVKDHLAWGEERGLIDFERGAKVAGNKFYYLKGPLVELELAVFQLGIDLAKKHGFTPMTVPNLVNTRTLEGAGFSARGAEKQIYKIEDEDLNLIATAEIPLTGYHADEILDEKSLPILYVGLSPAYRVEGGAYGKHNKGLFRTHQFNKLELYGFCKPQDSEALHQKMVALEEEMCQALEIPYRVVRMPAGDLSAPAYKKYDIEYWSPVDKAYRELMSCSNVTDYQARRLNIRYKSDKGNEIVHTLNGTLAAMSRLAIALIENHQTKDGKIVVPKALQKYMGGQTEF